MNRTSRMGAAVMAVVISLLLIGGSPVAAAAVPHRQLPIASSNGGLWVEGEVIVKFKVGSLAGMHLLSESAGLVAGLRVPRVAAHLPTGAVLLRCEGDVQQVVRELSKLDFVEYAQPNYLYRLMTNSDPLQAKQWGLGAVGAQEAWRYTQGTDDVVVAVIDTGVDYTHPDLAGNVWRNPGEADNGKDDDGNGYVDDVYGWDFFAGDDDPMDESGHGTHVAGIIAAVKGNGEGGSGVAPGVRVMALRAGDAYLPTSAIVRSIDYAAKMGARIVNMSFGTSVFDQVMYEAMAQHPELLFVAAAGNEGRDNDTLPTYPACFDLPNIVSVAAATESNERANFSNYGTSSVDVAAPGEAILSTTPCFGGAAAAVAVYSEVYGYQTVLWGFGAEDVVDATQVGEAVYRTLAQILGVPPSASTKVLLVDDDLEDGLSDVSTLYADALTAGGYVYDAVTLPEGQSLQAPISSDYAAVVWFTGHSPGVTDGWGVVTQPNLTVADRVYLEEYLQQGGKLFLSGIYAWYGIDGSDFFRKRFGAYFVNQVAARALEPATGSLYDEGFELVPGACVTLFAPLADVDSRSLLVPEPYGYMDGTSMAAPFVAGTAALVLSAWDASVQDVVYAIEQGVSVPDIELPVKWGGIVGAGAAVAYAAEQPLEMVSRQPEPGARDVPTTAAVTVRFNKLIKAVYAPAVAVRENGVPVQGVTAEPQGKVVRLTGFTLKPGSTYEVTLGEGAIKDLGEQTNDEITWGFSTVAAPAPPVWTPSVGVPEQPVPGEVVATGKAQVEFLHEGKVMVDIPEGALPQGAKLSVRIVADRPERVPEGARAVGPVVRIECSAPLAKPVRVGIRYDEKALEGCDPRAAMIYRLDEAGFTCVGGRVNNVRQMVVTELKSFSDYAPFVTPKTYTDVTGHWSQSAVELLSARGILAGTGAGLFEPDRSVTRAELAKMVVSLLGLQPVTPAIPSFSDVASDAWYFSAVETAVRAGVFRGYGDGTFHPDEVLTREQLAVVTMRIARLERPTTVGLPFADAAQVSGWAAEAVAAAYEHGLMRGVSATEFAPQGLVTRAQAAMLCYRLAERLALFEETTTLKGKVRWSTIEVPHYELEVGDDRYVLWVDPSEKRLAAALRASEGREVEVTGYVRTVATIYMRGPLLRVLSVRPVE